MGKILNYEFSFKLDKGEKKNKEQKVMGGQEGNQDRLIF